MSPRQYGIQLFDTHDAELLQDVWYRMQHEYPDVNETGTIATLSEVNAHLGMDLFQKVSQLASARDAHGDSNQTITIIDWGCGKGVALNALAQRVEASGLRNIRLIGFSNQYFPEWKDLHSSLIFIFDKEKNLEKHLPGILIDFMFSHSGLRYLDESTYVAHLRQLQPFCRPDAIILDYPYSRSLTTIPGYELSVPRPEVAQFVARAFDPQAGSNQGGLSGSVFGSQSTGNEQAAAQFTSLVDSSRVAVVMSEALEQNTNAESLLQDLTQLYAQDPGLDVKIFKEGKNSLDEISTWVGGDLSRVVCITLDEARWIQQARQQFPKAKLFAVDPTQITADMPMLLQASLELLAAAKLPPTLTPILSALQTDTDLYRFNEQTIRSARSQARSFTSAA